MNRLQILQIFSRYEYMGGEEGSVYRIGDALQVLHDIEYFQYSTRELRGSSFFGKALTPIKAYHNTVVARKLERFQQLGQFDCWQIHNVFPAMSPVVYEKAFQWGIPVVHYLHNYRLSCVNGMFLNHGQFCERCLSGNFWPAFRTKCWQESHTVSGLMGLIIRHARKLGLFEKVKVWIAISDAQKAEHIRMGLPADRIKVVHHFFENKRPALPPADRGHALFIGRLSVEKGVLQLLEAWKKLSNPLHRLVIAGEGPEESRLRAFVEDNRLTNVRFTGFLRPEEQAEIWAGAAFSVVPSIWLEPFGMVVLEAWGRGRTVIASRIGGLPEIVDHNRTGLLVEPGDSDSLATAMDRLFTEPEEAALMAAAGGLELAGRFNKAIWLAKMAEIYDSLFHGQRLSKEM